MVRGDELVDAQPAFDQRTNEPIITFRFNNAGARKFGNFTRAMSIDRSPSCSMIE